MDLSTGIKYLKQTIESGQKDVIRKRAECSSAKAQYELVQFTECATESREGGQE